MRPLPCSNLSEDERWCVAKLCLVIGCSSAGAMILIAGVAMWLAWRAVAWSALVNGPTCGQVLADVGWLAASACLAIATPACIGIGLSLYICQRHLRSRTARVR